jgi:hypothetical protein
MAGLLLQLSVSSMPSTSAAVLLRRAASQSGTGIPQPIAFFTNAAAAPSGSR